MPMGGEFEFSQPTGVDLDSLRMNGFGMAQMGQSRQIVIFYWRAVLNKALSSQNGKPTTERKQFIKIFEPGEQALQEIDREVTPSDCERWPLQYAKFMKGEEQIPEGTPLDNLFPTNPEVVANLKSWGIHVVEQLARLSPTGIDRVGMGAQDWVNRARRYLEYARQAAPFTELEHIKKAHTQEIDALKRQNTELAQKLAELGSQVAAQVPMFAAAKIAHDQAVTAQNRPLRPARTPREVSMKPVYTPETGLLLDDEALAADLTPSPAGDNVLFEPAT